MSALLRDISQGRFSAQPPEPPLRLTRRGRGRYYKLIKDRFSERIFGSGGSRSESPSASSCDSPMLAVPRREPVPPPPPLPY